MSSHSVLMARGKLTFRIRPVCESCAAKAQKILKVAPIGPISAQRQRKVC